MRRAESEITDQGALEEVLHGADLLFLALRSEPAPYVFPVCFGHDAGTLYVHGARVGTKIDILRNHPVVGFSACAPMTVTGGPAPCAFSAAARSIVGTGRARIVEDDEERLRGLDAIMRHYGVGGPFVYQAGSLARTSVIAIHIDTLHGKSTGQ
jgi:uncharacterized protein